MTNNEKAFEIAESHKHKDENKRIAYWNGRYNGALEMAGWKDEQFEKEKQQWIDKVCKLMQHWILEHDYVDIIELEDYIKQQIEE